ncbi:hypothetical protein E2C01_053050 [Portunus trituberculatus]|uniref:Uncharacterized protein n=1 Tax=Portunus trituberculatus TaxID=210409 RepID=A0A5B7GNG4_PORTR|nr:hypothetical protein [Portunus trituberculatus]
MITVSVSETHLCVLNALQRCLYFWNHAKSVLQLAKHSFINRKCPNLSNSNSPCGFWHLAKNISNTFTSSSFPPLFHHAGTTALSSVSKAELFSQTFAKNSTLDDSGLVPLSPSPSCLQLKFFVMMFSMFSLA